MAKERMAVARVRVTLEVPVNGTWGDDCTVAQVYKQAMDDARTTLRKHFNIGDGLVAGMPCCDDALNLRVKLIDMVPLVVISEPT